MTSGTWEKPYSYSFMKPLVFPFNIKLAEPSSSDKRADKERLIEEISTRLNTSLPIDLCLKTLRKLPVFLRENNFSAFAVISHTDKNIMILDVRNDDRIYAVVIDIGTTNLAASLYNMKTSEKICSLEHENPQVTLGLDVLTRVHLAMAGKADELHKLLIDGLNSLIKKLCESSGVAYSDIYAGVIAGNTIMSHFFANLNVSNIPIEPYIPTCHKFGFLKASELGINIHPESLIYIYPNAGSYVGGDIISGILSSGIYKDELPSLLIDVGTNAEIVLGCKDWMLVGAGAAGPALESGISEIGMRAIDGAIYSVSIEKDCEVKIKTIGNKEPIGVCGSGMIELISEMFQAGIINRQGKFQKKCPSIVEQNGNRGFLIYNSGSKTLIIYDHDIENFLRSKAAMFTFLYVLTRSVGMRFKDIHRVYISGAFGGGINAEKAVRIGMIPAIDKSKIIALGNSSLKGTEMLLRNSDLLTDIDSICKLITYKEMNTESEFMKEFPGALFIPHTNPEVLKA